MRQNTPNRILNFKNFQGVTPRTPATGGSAPRPPIGSRCCGSHKFQIVPARLGLGDDPQKLKQFADIVYRFWLQKRSQFENCAQFTCWL